MFDPIRALKGLLHHNFGVYVRTNKPHGAFGKGPFCVTARCIIGGRDTLPNFGALKALKGYG